MPRVGPDEVQVSYVLPKSLDDRVKRYQHRRELDHKKLAYIDLITKGLQVAEAEDRKAPKP